MVSLPENGFTKFVPLDYAWCFPSSSYLCMLFLFFPI